MKKILYFIVFICLCSFVMALDLGSTLRIEPYGGSPIRINNTRIYGTNMSCSNIIGASYDVCAGDGGGAVDYTAVQNYTESNCPANQVLQGKLQNGTLNCTTAGSDTNETTRFDNIIAYNCSNNQKAVGLYINGSLICIDDLVNTTAQIWAIAGNGTLETVADHDADVLAIHGAIAGNATTDTNETTRFDNLTSHNCTGTYNKMIGVYINGTPVCVVDLQSAGSGTSLLTLINNKLQVNTTASGGAIDFNFTTGQLCNTSNCYTFANLLNDTDIDTTIGNCSTSGICPDVCYSVELTNNVTLLNNNINNNESDDWNTNNFTATNTTNWWNTYQWYLSDPLSTYYSTANFTIGDYETTASHDADVSSFNLNIANNHTTIINLFNNNTNDYFNQSNTSMDLKVGGTKFNITATTGQIQTSGNITMNQAGIANNGTCIWLYAGTSKITTCP